MMKIFCTKKRPQLFSAVVFLALIVSGCVTAIKPAGNYHYGEMHSVSYNRTELELLSQIDPLNFPKKSDELYIAARYLAQVALENPNESPDQFIESILLNCGIYDRGATAYWHILNGKNDPWLKVTMKELKSADYQKFALAIKQGDNETAVAIIATRKSFFLKDKLPIFLKSQQIINFTGSVDDDLGMMKVFIMEPDNLIFEDHTAYMAGNFDYSLSFTKKGLYRVEFLTRGLDGDWMTVARFGFRVDTSKAFKPLSSPIETDAENYGEEMIKRLNGLRNKENRQRMESFEFLQEILKESSAKEAKSWPASTNVAQHPITIKLEHKLQCNYISSYTENLDTLIRKQLDTPSYRKAAFDYTAFSYQAAISQSGKGFRVSEMICSPYQQPENMLGRFQSARKQQEYQQIRQQRLTEFLGFNNGNELEKISSNWTLVQSFKLIDSLGGLAALIKGNRLDLGNKRSAVTSESLNTSELLDEAFVSIWQAMQEKQADTSQNLPENDALSLLLFQILLFQNRTDDYSLELGRLVANRNLSNLWLGARVQMAKGWLEAYNGNLDEALNHLVQAQRIYQSLKMDQTVQSIARQRMILRRRLGRTM